MPQWLTFRYKFRTVQKLEVKGNNGSQQVIKYEFLLFYLRFLSALWLTFISMNRSTSNDRENSITWATVQLKYFIEYSGEFCCFTIHYDAWKKFYEGLTRRVKKCWLSFRPGFWIYSGWINYLLLLNSFQANSFLFPLKTSENLWFCQGEKKGALPWSGLRNEC